MADKLTPQQEAAVKNRGGNLLVSAAAGSGKTKVLVDRLLSYLTDPVDPANVDDFLIITYTKAAAAELRGKIAARLTQVIAQQPNNKHLQHQLQRLYLAKISTVHAFCTDVLREYAYRLDIPGDFRVADENECVELQLRALDQLLNAAYERASEDPAFCAFVDSQGFGRDDRQVVEIILKVYNSARCHLDPEKWLNWCIETSGNGSYISAEDSIWGQYLIRDLHSYIDLHVHAMENCAHAASIAEGFAKPYLLLIDTIQQLKALRDSSTWDGIRQCANINYGRLVFDKTAKDTPLAERIKAVRNACKAGLEKKLRRFSDSASQALGDMSNVNLAVQGLVQLVRELSASYDKQKKIRRIMDFGDLEHKMLDLVLGKDRSHPTSVALELGKRFREVMVDEYQDSNAVQDAIFGALTIEKKNCFMVGDVKQSIYQFRLADPGIFLEKYNTYLPAEEALVGQGRKLLLTNNFRSAKPVIDAVNDVFIRCMSKRVGGLEYGADEMLYEGVPHEPIEDRQIELHCVNVESDTYKEEAEFTACRIIELLDGKHMVRDQDGLRPIIPDDIVILLRSPGSVGAQFQYALESRGIRCATGGSIDLLQTEEVSVLRSLLQIISNPQQDIPLVGVLTSRIFGFTADELAQIRSTDKKSSIFTALEHCENEKVKDFLRVISKLREEARISDLSALLETILFHTRLDSIYGALPDGELRKENLQAFYCIAAEYENCGSRSLVHFLSHLDAMEEKGLSVSSEDRSGGCVTIMSIHKSKGLEFPVVFLCGLSREFNRESVNATVLCDKELGLGLMCVDGINRVRYPSIAKRAIASKMLADSLSEELRVLYVAMTRAKDRLIMTYASKYLESEIAGLIRRIPVTDMRLLTAEASCPGHWILLTALQRTEAGELFALCAEPSNTVVSDNPWRISVSKADSKNWIISDTNLDESVLDPQLIDKIKTSLAFTYPYTDATYVPSKQTATQLKGRIKDREIAEGADVTALEYTWRKPTFVEDQPKGKFYGTAIHAVMQYIRFSACDSLESIRLEILRLAEEGYISPEQAHLADVEKISAFFLSPLGERLRNAKNVLREFKFSILESAEKYFENLRGEEILLQGVVDCALVEDDGITIIDFKTDRVSESTLTQTAEKYSPQILAYAQALERIYQLPVKASFLYFFHMDQFVSI